MLFKQLASLIAANGLLMLTVAHADADRLRVTINPTTVKGKKKDDDDEEEETPDRITIDKPIVVTGTPEELDVDLPEHLARFTQVRTTMREEFDQLQKDLDEAKAELEKAKRETQAAIAEEKKRSAKGIPTITPPALPPKPASKPAII